MTFDARELYVDENGDILVYVGVRQGGPAFVRYNWYGSSELIVYWITSAQNVKLATDRGIIWMLDRHLRNRLTLKNTESALMPVCTKL